MKRRMIYSLITENPQNIRRYEHLVKQMRNCLNDISPTRLVKKDLTEYEENRRKTGIDDWS